MSQHQTDWYLTIRQGPNVGYTYPLHSGSIVLGRRADNDIIIDAPVVSRYHARLVRQSNTYLLEDLGSANGTWVNNARIISPTLLHPGDVIGLGQDVVLVFTNQPQDEGTIYQPLARPASAVVAAPPATPATPSRASSNGQTFLALGVGGLTVLLGFVALAIIGVALYLLRGKPLLATAPTLTPTFTSVLPTATPYPTYTPYPTEALTATPYPTYTPYPTEAPTATPYPTYTPYPTEAPTATPYPTYTPLPHPVQPQPTPTSLPSATQTPPYVVTIGDHGYHRWGKPANVCGGPYDDRVEVRLFKAQVLLTNNSNHYISKVWPAFQSASGAPVPTCYWDPGSLVVPPGETIDVSFATFVDVGDWVKVILFDELDYDLAVCFGSGGQVMPCQ